MHISLRRTVERPLNAYTLPESVSACVGLCQEFQCYEETRRRLSRHSRPTCEKVC